MLSALAGFHHSRSTSPETEVYVERLEQVFEIIGDQAIRL